MSTLSSSDSTLRRTLSTASSIGSSKSASGSTSTHSRSGWDRNLSWPHDADSYELLQEVGTGASASVWSAVCIPLDRRVVAIKQVNLENVDGDAMEKLVDEARIMKDLHHHNIMPLWASFLVDEKLWMVMPFVTGGSLRGILQAKYPQGFRDEPLMATIALNVLTGLEHMHHNDRIHRDLKADNLMVHETGRILLADFGVTARLERVVSYARSSSDYPGEATGSPEPGLSRHSSQASAASYLARQTYVGTAPFMAPEVLEQIDGYGPEADMWSFGITLLELSSGRAPMSNASVTSITIHTLHEESPTLDSHLGTGHGFSPEMSEVIAACLDKEPRSRPSPSKLLKHRWFRQAKDSKYLARHLLGVTPSATAGTHSEPPGHHTKMHRTMGALARTWTMRSTSIKAASAEEVAEEAGGEDVEVKELTWQGLVGQQPVRLRLHLSGYNSKAEVWLNGVSVYTKKYKSAQQLSWKGDTYTFSAEDKSLGALDGSRIMITVKIYCLIALKGDAFMHGQQLPPPRFAARDTSTEDVAGGDVKAADISPSNSLLSSSIPEGFAVGKEDPDYSRPSPITVLEDRGALSSIGSTWSEGDMDSLPTGAMSELALDSPYSTQFSDQAAQGRSPNHRSQSAGDLRSQPGGLQRESGASSAGRSQDEREGSEQPPSESGTSTAGDVPEAGGLLDSAGSLDRSLARSQSDLRRLPSDMDQAPGQLGRFSTPVGSALGGAETASALPPLPPSPAPKQKHQTLIGRSFRFGKKDASPADKEKKKKDKGVGGWGVKTDSGSAIIFDGKSWRTTQ